MTSDGKARRGTLVISLDMEMYWGLLDVSSLAALRPCIDGARAAIPEFLRLFREFDIHATWAIVGFLFFDTRAELMAALANEPPSYERIALSPYSYLTQIGDNEADDPYHFAPSLITQIHATPHQEIGTHTFCHYYCLEPGQSLQSFRADIHSAMQIARQHGIDCTSIIFPRQQYNPAYLAVCRQAGLQVFRGNERCWVHDISHWWGRSPVARGIRLLDAYVNLLGHHTYALVELPDVPLVDVRASRFLRVAAEPIRKLEQMRLQRITRGLDDAARRGRIYHLWWHPENFGLHTERKLAFLRQVLEHYAELRDQGLIESLHMCEVAERVRHLRSLPAVDAM